MKARARMRPYAIILTVGALCTGIALAADRRSRDDLSDQDAARVARVTAPATDFAEGETFEAMQGGSATTTKSADSNAFSHPSANLDFQNQQRFLLGNGLFRKDWVSAPSSTQASDGLGPLFNARACQSCHFKDGRGHAPTTPAEPALSLLVRLSIPPEPEQAEAIAAGLLPAAPDPVYGLQLQDLAVAGMRPEGRVRIDWEEMTVDLNGGETVSLRRPSLSIVDPGHGAFAPGLMTSARVAPPMVGLGLLGAIHEADIVAREDPDDTDGDGISGRANWRMGVGGQPVLGRFGWKALEPSVLTQTAHAFSGDMGLSTRIAPDHWGDCTQAQAGCRAMPHGAQERYGAEEVPGDLLDLVTFYSSHLAVPRRRNVHDPEVLAGKRAFYQAGCVACHSPKYVTSRDAPDPAHRFQLIWPYTDLLLHDMGDDLADDRTEGLADGREWRTPPLWAIGLNTTVSSEATFLHDGRARTLLEAVLWHGGEAKAARDRVVDMSPAERAALVRFLESL